MRSRKPYERCLDLRPAPLDPKLAARHGPLELKEPGSFEWTVQITHKAQRLLVSVECSTKEWKQTIAEIDAAQPWKTYPPEKPYGTREVYFKEEFGRFESELTRAKEEQQDELAKHGGDRKSEVALKRGGGSLERQNQRDVITLKRGTQTAYITARLRRDASSTNADAGKREAAAAILPRVESGEITAHAAAVALGWRGRMVQHPPTVEGYLRSIRKHLNAAQQAELWELWKDSEDSKIRGSSTEDSRKIREW